MKKNLSIYLPILTIIACILFILITNDSAKKNAFQCSHELSIDMKKQNKLVKFRTHTTYTYYKDGTGTKTDVGIMDLNGQVYTINRRYEINYHIEGNVIDAVVVGVSKSNKDTAPQDETLLENNERINYHTIIQRLFGGAYLMQIQGYPVAVCT
jgi:hypothetical protein